MAAVTSHPHLFSPFELRGRTLRNRIVSTPHATGWGHDGLIDRREVDYHVRKAAGGCALVMTFGSASVDPTTAASYGSIAIWDERNEAALRALADGVHANGALCISQLTHMGRRGTSTTSGIPLRSSSNRPEGVHLEVPVPLDADELGRIADRFAAAAQRLERCGWDGCEVTSIGGHLIEQFFDPAINDRSDAYGGSVENRTRFGREVLAAVRAAVSDRFIVSFRMTVDQCLPDGLGPDDLIEIARNLLTPAVPDLLSLSGGTCATRLATAYAVPGDELPEGVFNDQALRFRQALGLPVLVAGRNLEPELADACVAGGVDLVAMTRAIIADPDLPTKAAAGIRQRPCIGCNEGCIGRLYRHLPMWCAVNPGIREPDLERSAPTAVPRRVVIVGGGVGGLEAARGAARRGHHVMLYERRDELGGRARLALRRRNRERWGTYIDWVAQEATDAGADVRRGVDVTAATIAEHTPDIVVIATGSELRPDAVLPGPLPVLDVDDLLEHGVPTVERRSALILDDEAGFLAATAAEALTDAGYAVEIATAHGAICAAIDETQQPFVIRRLLLAGVIASPNLAGVVSDEDGVTLRHLFTERDERRDGVGLVVVAGRRQARATLRHELHELRPELEIVAIGDALAPRTLLDAVAEGARVGAEI